MKIGRGPEEEAPSRCARRQGHDPAASDTACAATDGYLTLDSTHANFNFCGSPTTDDWKRGTVSKIDTKTLRETARYFSVTCASNPAQRQDVRR